MRYVLLSLPQLEIRSSSGHGVLRWLNDVTESFVNALLDVELGQFLRRRWYGRSHHRAAGLRNGYKNRLLRTADGVFEIRLPQTRQTAEPYLPTIWSALRKRRPALTGLVIQAWHDRDLDTHILRLLDHLEVDPHVVSAESVRSMLRDRPGWRDEVALHGLVPQRLRIHSVEVTELDGRPTHWCVVWCQCARSDVRVLTAMRRDVASECALQQCLTDLKRRGLPPPISVTCEGCSRLEDVLSSVWPLRERRTFWTNEMSTVLCRLGAQQRRSLRESFRQLAL